MSRSGYSDDYDENNTGGLWRGAVAKSITGKRGQNALHEILNALDAMQVKSLAAESLVAENGEFCTLGALGHARGLDMASIDPEDWGRVAKVFDIAPALVREIVFENDENIASYEYEQVTICGPMRPYRPDYGNHTKTVRVDISPETLDKRRWVHMRHWVESRLTTPKE